MASLRILVVDDEKSVRSALGMLLRTQPGWEVVGEAADGAEAIGKAEELKPDVVILDVSMPKMGGLEAAAHIKKVTPQSEVLMFSQHDSPFFVRQAQSAGARGYLLKSQADRLVVAVQTVGGHRDFYQSVIAPPAN